MISLQQIVFVSLIWLLILGGYSVYSVLFMPLVYKNNKLYFSVLFPLILISFALVCYSYYKTIFTDPGSPPPDINSHYDNLHAIVERSRLQEETRHAIHSGKYPNLQTQFDEVDSLTRISYCFKCQKIKPIRTHHCRMCNKCNLRMDHHCPWVGNCVGKHNHKYFLLFLFYATFVILLSTITIFADYMSRRPYANSLTGVQRDVLYISFSAAAMIGLAVMFLLGFQIYLLAKNITTVENFVDGMSERQPFNSHSLGQNMREIMGDSFWLVPSSPFPSHRDYTEL